jgi:hypothetical protein
MDFAPTHRGLWLKRRTIVHNDVFIRRFRAMGIRDRPSPRQNRYCERAIGSIRREVLTTLSCSASGRAAGLNAIVGRVAQDRLSCKLRSAACRRPARPCRCRPGRSWGPEIAEVGALWAFGYCQCAHFEAMPLMNPKNAAARGIENGSVVRVLNERGQILAGAVLTDDIIHGAVRVNEGAWYDPLEPGVAGTLCKNGCVNVLTLAAIAKLAATLATPRSTIRSVVTRDGQPPTATRRPVVRAVSTGAGDGHALARYPDLKSGNGQLWPIGPGRGRTVQGDAAPADGVHTAKGCGCVNRRRRAAFRMIGTLLISAARVSKGDSRLSIGLLALLDQLPA